MQKAAPIEYVKTCAAHGIGFFYIPGTDTCIKVGGRAQFSYSFIQYRFLASDRSNFIGTGRLQVDARTSTAWGTLRTFVRFDIASRTGQQVAAATTLRGYGPAGFNATGVDTYNRAYKYVEVDKAFIQFAGLTAGRASSFYDFYVTDIELSNFSITSNVSATNLLAYTYQFGGGFSATLSVEDPTFRRNPLFYANSASVTGSALTGFGFAAFQGAYANQVPGAYQASGICGSGVAGCTYGSPVYLFNAAGQRVGYAFIDISQRNQMPDIVANLRVDQGWGSAQISGAVHQISVGQYYSSYLPGATVSSSGSISGTTTQSVAVANGINAPRPDAAYGYAVQAGVKFKLDMLAPGDALWLQAAYAQGAMSYTGVDVTLGREIGLQGGIGGGTRFNAYKVDGYVDPNSGDIKLSRSWSMAAAFLHYWTPQWRSGFVFTYGGLAYPSGARLAGPLGNVYANAAGVVTASSAAAGAFNIAFKDFQEVLTLANLIWSPVKDLDIGVEAVYGWINIKGRVYDNNRGGAATGATASADGSWLARLRIDRTF